MHIRLHSAQLVPLPISYLVSLTFMGILGTVPLGGYLEVMLGTATETQPLSGNKYLPTQLPIAISQSVAENKTCD